MQVTARYQAVSDAESRSRGERLLQWLRAYGETRVSSRLIDERRCIPPYVVLDLGNQGLFGIQVEEAFGGLALRSREVGRVLEQAAALDLGLGTFLLTSLFPGVRPIASFGSEALKAELLPALAAGRILAGYAQTEPGAGTHFPAMAARAQAEPGGSFHVSGEKIWIGNASWAAALTVFAHQVEADGRRRGLTALVVRTDQPGVVLGPELLSLGMRGMVQGLVAFRDVAVGPGAVLGRAGQGLEVGVDSMSWSRFAIAATCIGAMKRCAQLALRFAGRRSIATGRLLEHPVALSALGEAAFRVAACEALLYRVAADVDAGSGVSAERFAVCKAVASELLWQTADETVQLLGSRGYDEENLAPQILRDARVTRIFEGASEPLFAFVGAQALQASSELHAHLEGDLDGAWAAARLADAVRALRARGAGGGTASAQRAWQCALAGQAASWALAAAALRQDAARGGELLARAAAWAERGLADACERAARGSAREAALLTPPEVEKAVAGFAESIGDVEQALPGERIGLDPLLRRDADS